MPDQPLPQVLTDDGIFISLTDSPLDVSLIFARVKSPKAGAIVLFTGISGH